MFLIATSFLTLRYMFAINSKLFYTPLLISLAVATFFVFEGRITPMEMPGFLLIYISLPYFVLVWFLILFQGTFKWVDKILDYFE